MTSVGLCVCRQELSALHADLVRKQAEEDAYHAQQVNVFVIYLCEANISLRSCHEQNTNL